MTDRAERDARLMQAIDMASDSEKLVLLAHLEELNKRETRATAQASFMPFVQHIWPDFINGSHHKRIAKLFEEVAAGEKKRVIINLPPRHAITTNTNIPTINGFKTMAELQVGEYVFGPDGLPVQVIDKSEVFTGRELYRVSTDDGFSIDVDGEHLWTVRLDRKYNVFHNYTTEQLWLRQQGANIWLPNCVHVKYEEKDLFPGTKNRHIKIEKLVTTGDTQCIKVAREDGLFLAGEGYICTHNTKSEFASYLLPAWFLGKFPKKKIMQVSNTSELAEGFGRKVRNLVGSDIYKEIFPDVGLRQDSKAAGRWNTNQGGDYYACGVGSALAGRGADICLAEFTKIQIDDGEIYLKDVKIGDKIKTINGWERVTRKIYTTHERYVRINNDIEASFEHKFLTDKGWKMAGELRLGDRILTKTALSASVTELSYIGEKLPMIDITVEPSHEFLVKCNSSWLRTHNCIVDDPHTENEALAAQFNPAIYDKVYEWFTSGPRQRLQPGGALIIVMTRWGLTDLTGQIIDASLERSGADQWEVIEFPAILPSGNPLWPEFWSIAELEAIRAEIPVGKWQAQYQQQPTSEQAAIIKREWWQMWEHEHPPTVEFIIMAMDTAFEAKNSADYSAAVIFGVWNNPNDNDQPNLILLNMWRDKLEFPDLKVKTLELYKEWEPDAVIIEKKASGAPLITELRRMGVPVQDYTPVRGTANNPNSKPVRLHAVADVFASGKVWAPANKRWAEVLIDEVAAFPAGKNDDLVDCVSMAVKRYRDGGFIGTNLDAKDEPQYFARKAAYY